jgi:hypothetical protein
MYQNTKRKMCTTIVILVVAAIALTMLAPATFVYSAFAAKTGTSHHSSKDSNGIGVNGDSSGSVKDTNTDSSSGDTQSTTTNNDNTNLKNLFACESTAANGSGQLTENEVINCYSQAFSNNSVSSPSTIGNNNNSPGDTSSSGTTSSGSDSGSFSSHTQHHHHSSTGLGSSSKDSTASSSSGQ